MCAVQLGSRGHFTSVIFLHTVSYLINVGAGITNDRCVYLHYEGKQPNEYNIGCPQTNTCRKTFNISVIKLPPFSLIGPVVSSLTSCCGNCTKYKVVHEFQNVSEINSTVLKSSDILLPFLGHSNREELFGYHFIPFFDVTDAFYITERGSPRLFHTILQLYPLMIICFFLAILSGFVGWLTETWENKEEFPREFLHGWFEGVWWSFVTMTTVGYGDKCPKSIAGRLFAVVWILIGLVTCGILTATLTTEIITLNSPPPPLIKDAKVGALKYRDYEQLIIADKGGVLVQADGIDFYSEMLLLIDKLQKKEIDGILLEKTTLHFFTMMMNEFYLDPNIFSTLSLYPMTPDSLQKSIDYFLNATIRTELQYKTEKLSYGILMKNREDYDYFHHAIGDNRLRRKIEYDLHWNEAKHQKRKNKWDLFYCPLNILFSPTEKYFQNFLMVVGVSLVAISGFGLSYELHKRGTFFYLMKNKKKSIIYDL